MSDIMPRELKEHLLAKTTSKFGWTEEEAEFAIGEFIKFMQLALVAPPLFIPVIEEIDEIWHLSILQTEAYEKLCEALSPGNFLHHKSETYEKYSTGVDSAVLLDECVSWTVNYLVRFDSFSTESIKYWTFPKFLVNNLGWSVAEVNALRELNPLEIKTIIGSELDDK